MSNAILVKGSKLYWGDSASTEVFTAFAEVVSADGPTNDRGEIDVTHWQSTDKEYKPGYRDRGTISGTMNYISADYAKLRELYETDTNSNFRIEMANGDLEQFEGFVKSCGRGMASGDRVVVNFSLRVSGTLTPVSA